MNDVTTIALLGGGTGAGATTALVGLATRAAAAGRDVAVVDADPCGGGIDMAFGLETEQGVRWEDLLGSDGPLNGERLAERLPARADGPRVLSFGRQWCELRDELLGRAVSALSKVSDMVLVDLGRDLRTMRTADYDEVLLVSRGSPCGLAAAGATAQRIERPVLLLVRGMREPQARDAAEALGLELAGCLPEDRHLPGDSERGVPAGSRGRSSYAAECDRLLRELLVSRKAAA